MEIKIKETNDFLEIEKIHKKELFYSKTFGLLLIVFIIWIFREYIFSFYWYIIIPIISPFLFIIFRITHFIFLSEYLYINKEKIIYFSGYSEKKEKMAKREYKVENLITFFARKYERPLFSYPNAETVLTKLVFFDKTDSSYRIHFHFKGEIDYFGDIINDYEAFGFLLDIKKAEEIAKKIEIFLEKKGMKVITNPEIIPFEKKEEKTNLYTDI